MKFPSFAALEKHLGSTEPLKRFLFVSSCDYEKRLWTEAVVAAWRRRDPGLQVARFSVADGDEEAALQEIASMSLWGGLRAIVVSGVDKAKVEEWKTPSDVVLILLASSLKSVAKLCQESVATLDTSGEKPWDRDTRIRQWVQERVRKEGKEMASDVVSELISLLGTDLAQLDQELKKVMVYVGTKKFIDLRDVEAVCGARDLAVGWQLAESLVWKGPIALQEKGSDLGFVLPFLGQVRYHLQLGAQMAELLERKMDLGVLSARPQMVAKLAPIAKKRGRSFFLRGILSLYELEFSAKSSSLDTAVLFDLFQGKLYEASYPTT